MPLKRLIFTVYLDDPDQPDAEPIEHVVEVRAGDQLRAELEGKKRGVKLEDAMHQSHLWVWAAMVRTGTFAGKFEEFVDRCVQLDDEPDEVDVDPTAPAVSPDSA